MAKYGKTLAEVLVQINGTSQTKKVLEALTQTSKELGDKIKVARAELEKLAESGGGPAYDAKKKELAAMVKEQAQLNRAINETNKFSKNVGDILNNMSDNNISVLNRTKRTLESLLNSITPNTKTAEKRIEQLQKAIQKVTDEIARRKGQLVDLDKVMSDLGKATPKQLDAVEKRLQTLLESVTKNSNAWRKYNKQLQTVQEEKSSRRKSFMEAQMENVAKLSVDARNELKKYWQSVNDGAKEGSKAFRESLKYLQEIGRVETEMATKKAKKVLEKPKNYSVGEINDAIKAAEQMQASTKDKKEWADLADQIAKAKEVRDSFADSAKLKVMSDQFKHVKNLSANAFAEQKKYWAEIKNNLVESDPLYKKAAANLERMNKIESDRMLKQSKETLTTNINTSGTADIKQSVEWLTKYQATLEPLSPKWQKINDLIQKGNERLKEVTDTTKYNEMNVQFDRLSDLSANALAEQKKYWTDIKNNFAEGTKKYDEAIDKLKEIDNLETGLMKEQSRKTLSTDLFTSGTADIKQSIEWLTKYQGTLEPLSGEWRQINDLIAAGDNRLKQLSDDVKMEAMADQFSRLTQLSEAALSDQKKYWEDVFRNAEKGTENYNIAEGKLQQIKDMEKNSLRTEATATISQAIAGNFDKTNEETREAIKLIEEYKKQLATGNVDAIKEADKAITELNHKLDQAKKSSALDVLGDKDNHSTEQIKEAVSWLTKYRSTLATSTQEWKDLGVEIEKANEYMRSAEGADKMALMEQKLNSIGTVSTSVLSELKKYWQEVVDSTDKNNTNLAQYEDNLRRVIEEEKARKAVSADAVMANLDGSSVTQIREAIKATEELRESVKRSDPQWAQYNTQIENAKNYLAKFETEAKKAAALDVAANLDIASTGEMKQTIDFLTKYRDTLSTIDPEYDSITQAINDTTEALKEFNDSVKMDAMNKQMQNLNNLSKAALAEQKKYWQGVYDSAEKTSQAYKDAENNLLKLDILERSRTKADATQNITEALSGNWDKTIEETQQAIKLIEEYKKQLRTQTDSSAIEEANKAIEALNANLGKAKEGLMDYNEALKIADEVRKGTFDGTSEEIEKAKKALEAYRKTLKQKTDADSIRDVDKALQNLTRTAGEAGKKLADVDYVLGHLDSSSMEELQSAAKQLQEQLSNATRGTEDYVKQAEKLREVNAELKKAKKEWEGQENVITKTAKRLAAYVAVYGGFNAIIDKMKEVVGLNLQLSDSMADVQKTTGLAGVELQELGRELASIDTRTATTELYQLAAAAGQVGLKTQEDVLGFAKAANIISVALNELGAEGSATITKIATLTGDVAKSGTEQALLKVGSAINELTANSAATAGPIADFISRVGGIASASKIAIHEMAALGAATDASAQSIEIAGTSMNKFISALVSNTENIAYATNLSAKELQDLISNGNTMQAVIRVLESMQNMDRSGIAGAMKELGSEGARMNQYIASMVSNLDMLKRQLAISKEAFDENVSVINEYNVKQESAMGILQRMKNAFLDTFVNSKMTVILRDVLEWIAAIPRELEKWPNLLLTIKVIISQILLFKLPFLLHKLMIQLSGMYALLAGPTLSAIKAFRHAWRQAELELVFAGKSVNALSISLKTLGNIIKAHPIMFIASIITAGAVAWMHFKNKTDEVTEAMQELNEKHTRQIEELDALRAALDSTNASYATRAAAMREINSLYSKYLGFELSELDAYEKKSKALDYINAKLKENQAIEQENRQREVYTEQFSTESKDEMKEIRKVFESIPEITAARVPEAIEVMNNAIKEGATTYEEVLQKLAEYFNSDRIPHYTSFFDNKDDFNEYIRLYSEFQTNLTNVDKGFANLRTSLQNKSNQELWELNAEQQRRIASLRAQGDKEQESEQIAHLQNLLKEEKEYLETSKRLQEAAKSQDYATIRNNTNTDKTLNVEGIGSAFGSDAAKLAEGMNKQIEQLKDLREKAKNAEVEATKAELAYKTELQKENNEEQIRIAKAEYDKLAKERDDYNMEITNIDMKWQDNMRTLQTNYSSEVRKQWTTLVDEVEKSISTLQVKIAGDPWGKAFNLKDWKDFPKLIEGLEGASVVSLVEGFKKLRDNTKLITKDVESFNKMFQLETPLKSLDEVNTQVFDWANQIRQELKKRNRGVTGEMLWGNPKEEMDFVLNQIKTYFLKRQAQIRKSYIDGMVTSEEMKRRLDENNNALLDAQIQFQKMMLGQESSFTEMFIPGIESHDLTKLRTEIRILGDEVTDEIEKSLAENENTVVEGAQKIKEALDKELRAGDPFGTLRESFRSSLDSLKLMSSEYEREIINDLRAKFPELTDEELGGLTEEKMQERLDFLMELAQASYTVDKDGLRKMFEGHEEYYAWVDKLDDTQMEVMLNKLQWFYDESLVKQANYRERILKGLESSYLQQEEKMTKVAELEWKIEKAKSDRQNLQNENAAYESSVATNKITKDKYDSNIQEIISYNQTIKKLEEDLIAEREKADKDSKSRKKQKEREAKDEMEASISALEAYYNEQEAMIRKRALENGSTQATLDRELRKNTIAAERDLIQLRKKLLGQESAFDPNANGGYEGAVTGTIFFGKNKTEEMLKTQAEQIKVWGKALMDGMRNQIAKGEITIQEALQKQKDKIEKILLEDDFSGKVMHEYAEAIDELGLLFNINETLVESDEELGKARLTYMREWAKDAYAIDATGLEDRIKANNLFSEWIKDRSKEDYEALLIQLRKFNDDMEEADRKAAERRKKIFDNSAKGISVKQQGESNEKQAENDSEMWKRFQGLDLVSENTVDRAQIELYEEKIQSSMAYIDQIKAEMAVEKAKSAATMASIKMEIAARKAKGLDTSTQQAALLEAEQAYNSLVRQEQMMTLEAQQNIAEQRALIADTEMSIEQRKVEKMKQYTDAVVDFAGKMTEAEWDDVESRKEAGRELIKTLLTLLKNQIQIWTTELVMKKMFAQQSTSTTAGQVGTEMTLKAAETEADIVAGTASATAKEAGKKGWIGLAVGAAIGAALSALLGLAMNAINKTKSVADSMSGNKKLATGMLTYKDGNYPVLGNDGKVYDAKYEGAGMKTGIYGGGAHFGIFSEKQPEMIVDGKTTQKLILNYPYIYDAITTIAKNGRLVNAMPTFATGDYPAGMKPMTPIATVEAPTGNNEQMERTNAVLEQATSVIRELSKVLTSGQISANVDPYANRKATQRAEKFMKRRGID